MSSCNVFRHCSFMSDLCYRCWCHLGCYFVQRAQIYLLFLGHRYAIYLFRLLLCHFLGYNAFNWPVFRFGLQLTFSRMRCYFIGYDRKLLLFHVGAQWHLSPSKNTKKAIASCRLRNVTHQFYTENTTHWDFT